MTNYQKFLVPIGAVGLTAWAWQTSGWMGVFLVFTGGVMWVLMYFTRLVQIMKRASNRPIGFVDSAVMLNAKLKPGMNLMHIVAMTRALGQQESRKDAQPEIFSWRDGSQSVVRCSLVSGKLQSWTLDRPFQAQDVEPAAVSAND